ncbi:MAG TPA: DNA-binding response regulator, partial [Lachnospiraceae bacterium]|nr:DNA-binding response regulator [Lachnospiraceae bacterium]
LVRIQVQLRRQAGKKENDTGIASCKTYHYRDWVLDADAMEMTAAGIPVTLTRHEFLILEL